MPLFIALAVSYMLKDRIKELMRSYFAHKRLNRYFDNKTKIGIKDMSRRFYYPVSQRHYSSS